MITKNPMQLKAFIKNKAAEKHISAQLVMQNYMLERLLERISLSPYKNNFILKGGFLISAIVGLDTRATMDLDTTIKGFTLTHETIRKIFAEICAVRIADDVHILYALRGAECDRTTLRRALERTTQKRGSGMILSNYQAIMKEIRKSDALRKRWQKYSCEYEYAREISFDDTCNTIQTIMHVIMS